MKTSSLNRVAIIFILALPFFITGSCDLTSKGSQVKLANNNVYEINPDLGQDSNIIHTIKPYKDSLDLMLNKVIGYSDMKMAKGYPEGLLGNFITDLAMHTININYKQSADFCIFNNGGFRSSLPSGAITLMKIYEIMPFENEVVILEINGETMDQLLQYFIKGENLCVSGMKLQILQNQTVMAEIQGSQIDKTKTYKLITSDYLADGGGKMYFLKNAVSRKNLKIKVRDLIIDYIEEQNKKGFKLTSKLDGRIKVIQ
jgi:2',3'-cyclic-nucleotide 2'-phosphodiesterase (5'-nucleotidase family)